MLEKKQQNFILQYMHGAASLKEKKIYPGL